MKKLSVFLLAIFGMCIWFSFAAPSILSPSYSINGDTVNIYWTDASNWWYLSVNVKNPEKGYRSNFGEVKMSDWAYSYPKQRQWDQEIQLVPWDGWDIIEFTARDSNWTVTVDTSSSTKSTDEKKEEGTTRTVIPAVPKTGPSAGLIWIILATLAIFGGYIYIKKRADI
jgi:hypothetical protein